MSGRHHSSKSILDLLIIRKKKAWSLPRVFQDLKKRKISSDRDVRQRLLKLQHNRCAGLFIHGKYHACNNYPTECDHIIERQFGGQDTKKNCQMLCRLCHRLKTQLNRWKRNGIKKEDLIKNQPSS
jgi:HNH endonuclease